MGKGKILNIIAIVIFVFLIITVAIVGFLTYNLIFPEKEDVININYDELLPTEVTTVPLSNSITSNLTMTEEDEMPYFAIVEISYEVANLEEYEEEATQIIEILNNNEVVIRRIAINEIRKRTYKEMLTNTIYDELADDILLELQNEFDSELICNVIINEVIAG